MQIDMLQFIPSELLILIPIIIVLGKMLKGIPNILDWSIPFILSGIGILLGIGIMIIKKGFSIEAIYYGGAGGIISTGFAVYVYQLRLQVSVKRYTDLPMLNDEKESDNI